MFKRILDELRHHAPFTIFGALSGILIMILFRKTPSDVAYRIFYTLHPFHVLLSALVTTSMYGLHKCHASRKRCSILPLLLIGYIGSVGIATLSDSLIPYLGESLLDMPHRQVHVGFIEEWWIVNPLAILGIAIAYFKPGTRFPHAGHVLLSTFASIFHIIMALGRELSLYLCIGIFVFLFISVWIPCCVSDIVFPLLFVRKPSADK